MKKLNFKNYPILPYLASFILICLIIYQCLPDNIIYCDGNISNNDISEAITLNSMSQYGDRPQDTTSDMININCSTAFAHYKDRVRCKILWYSCIKSKGIYSTYEAYKVTWDPNTKVFSEMQKQFKQEIDERLHNIKLAKRTMDWIFKPSTRGSGRRGQ